MYCKYCGSQIADDSVFCAKCGKLVAEASPSNSVGSFQKDEIMPSSNERQMVSTQNLQWKIPYFVRVVQLFILLITSTFLIYCAVCLIGGGKVVRDFAQSRTLSSKNSGTWQFIEERQYEEKLVIKDAWGIFNTEARRWNQPSFYTAYGEAIPWAFSYQDIQKEKATFRTKVVFMGMLPTLLLLWVIIRWIKRIRFPKETDGIPADVADEIEQYEWNGFGRYKYVLFKKDGKYGVVDARNYCVCVPAQYDSITWRMPDKTIDVVIGEEKQTITIEKEPKKNE